MAGLDLAADRTVMGAELVDTCVIVDDSEARGDDVFDETAGVYVRPPADTTTVYQGTCLVMPVARREQAKPEGGQTVSTDEYRLRLPAATATVELGHLVTVTAVHTGGDVSLPGREFVVTEVLRGSHLVSRRVIMTARTRSPR